MNNSPLPAKSSTDAETTVAALRSLVADFVHERDWEQFHDPKNLSMAIATEAAELMEHFRWAGNAQAREMLRDPAVLAAVSDEVADVLAFLLSFANVAGIDLGRALRAKMARNALKYPVEQFKGRA